MKAASECSRKTGFRASISNLHPFPKTLKKKKIKIKKKLPVLSTEGMATAVCHSLKN